MAMADLLAWKRIAWSIEGFATNGLSQQLHPSGLDSR